MSQNIQTKMRMGLQICHLTCCILALSENKHNMDNLKHGFVDTCLQNVMDCGGEKRALSDIQMLVIL